MGVDQPDQRYSLLRQHLPTIWRWLDRLAPLPIAIASVAVVLALVVDDQRSYEQPLLLLGLNLVFSTLVAVTIAAWAGRLVYMTERPDILLLGCGALTWGLSACIGVVAGLWPGGTPFNANILVTIHNIGVWVASLCHLAGAAIFFKPYKEGSRPSLCLPIAYTAILALAAFIAHAALQGWTPPFFVPGEGGTETRQLVLGSAITMFVLTGILLQERHYGTSFARWYSMAMVLVAVGLFGVLFQKTNGSFLGWTGRLTQYLGGLYMLVAVSRQEYNRRAGLENLSSRSSDDTTEPQLLLAIALAVVSSACAVAFRLFFLHELGTTLSYLTFFPAVMLAAFIGGFLPAMMTIFLSVLLVFFFWTEPSGRLFISDHESLMEVTLFVGSSLAIAYTAHITRRAQTRAVVAETEARLADERAKAAEALHLSEERLARVIEATEVGIWDWHVQTGVVVFNDRWAEMVGYTLAELQPVSIQTWIDLVHPDDYLQSEAQLAEVFSGIRPLYNIDCRMRHRQGHWVWIQDRGKVIEWTDDGKPLRMTGFHVDITLRKQAEERLAALMRETATILDAAPIGIVKVIDRRLVWSNRAIERMLGYSKEELLYQPTKTVYAFQQDYEQFGKDAYLCLAQGGICEGELLFTRKDGVRLNVRLTGQMIVPEAPALGTIWTIENITERKAIEEAARERAALYHDLFASNLTVNLLVDPNDGTIIDANAAAVAFYGYSHEQLLTMQIGDINIAPPEEIREAMTFVSEQERMPFQVRHRLNSGELRDVEVYSSPITICGRSVLHSIVVDVTQRRRLEQTLREQQKLLHSMTEGTSDAIYIKDWGGRYLMCNSASARYLGVPVASVLGKDDLAFFSTEDAQQIMEGDRRVLESGAVQTFEEHVHMHDGLLTFLSTKGPVRNVSGAVVGLFGIARDITERKKMEQALEQSRQTAVAADQAKSKLLATVAHEFRTPLSLLTSSLDIIDRYGHHLNGSQLDEQNNHIRNAARQLTTLTETVLTYRTMGIDALRADPQPCIIIDLCRTVAEETRVAWSQEHAFNVSLQLAEDDILLMDCLLFRRIVANLLANAFQYTPTGGEVTFEVRREADGLLLTVADRGIGMEYEDVDRIFTPFYRGRNVGSRRGVGLGLNIVHDAVTQFGGTISVTSTLGVGTKFVVTLPWREVEE